MTRVKILIACFLSVAFSFWISAQIGPIQPGNNGGGGGSGNFSTNNSGDATITGDLVVKEYVTISNDLYAAYLDDLRTPGLWLYKTNYNGAAPGTLGYESIYEHNGIGTNGYWVKDIYFGHGTNAQLGFRMEFDPNGFFILAKDRATNGAGDRTVMSYSQAGHDPGTGANYCNVPYTFDAGINAQTNLANFTTPLSGLLLNTIYTNANSRAWVRGNFLLTPDASHAAQVTMWIGDIEQDEFGSNVVMWIEQDNTINVGPAGKATTAQLTDMVNPNWVFMFTNESVSGATCTISSSKVAGM